MKHLFTLVLLAASVTLSAQISGHWTRFLDIPDAAGVSGYVDDIFASSDGQLYVTGGNPYDTLSVVKYNEFGNMVWQNVYTYMGVEFGRSGAYPSVGQLSDGDLVIAANDYSVSPYKQWVLRVDTSGTLLWATPIPPAGSFSEYGKKLVVDGSDRITFQSGSEQIVRLSASGSILWSHVTPAEFRYEVNFEAQPDGDIMAIRTNHDTLPGGYIYSVCAIDRISSSGAVTTSALPVDTTAGPEIAAMTTGGLFVVKFNKELGGIYFEILYAYREDFSLAYGDTIYSTEHQMTRKLVPGTSGDLYSLVDFPEGLIHYDSTLNRLWDISTVPAGLELGWWMDVKVDGDNTPYVRGYFHNSTAPAYDREAVSAYDPVTGALLSHTMIAENLPLSTGLQHFECNGSGVFWDLMEDYDNLYILTKLVTSGLSANLSGSVWKDADADCVEDMLELPWPGMLVETTPHHFVATSDLLGDYYMALWPDTHEVMVHVPPYRYVSCSGAPYEEIVTGSSVHAGIDFGVASYPGITDMVALVAGGPARPGFDQTIWTHARNIGTVSASGRLRFEFDPLFTYGVASPAPDSVLPGALVWNYTTLAEWDHINPYVSLYLPPSVPIGTPYAHLFRAITSVADTTPHDNVDTLAGNVTGAYDPNAKYFKDRGATASLGVASDSLLWFEIYFQNTGTDTAFTVLVKDTLEADLDWGRATTWITSHPATFTMSGHGYAEWRFDNILLPDSNTNEPASHGYILFSVPVRAPIFVGKTITNSASIYFDYNVPVLTNTALGTYDGMTSTTPVLGDSYTVYPNPFGETLRIRGTSDCSYQLCDLSGRILQSGALRLGTDGATVATQALVQGVYLLRLQSQQGEVTTFKVVKTGDH